MRRCNWVRFLRLSLVMCDTVNLLATNSPEGTTFEVVRRLAAGTELVAFLVPQAGQEVGNGKVIANCAICGLVLLVTMHCGAPQY